MVVSTLECPKSSCTVRICGALPAPGNHEQCRSNHSGGSYRRLLPHIPRIRCNVMKQKRDYLLLPISEHNPQTTAFRGDLGVLGIGSREGLTQWFVASFHVWPNDQAQQPRQPPELVALANRLRLPRSACMFNLLAGRQLRESFGGVAGRSFGQVRFDLLLQIDPSVSSRRACYILRLDL
jgi:hypothetical protein